MKNLSKGVIIFILILTLTGVICSLLLSIINPFFLIMVIIFGIYLYKSIKELSTMKKEKQNNLENEVKYRKMGYSRLYDNLLVNEREQSIIINNNAYKFNQIIDCELISNTDVNSMSYGQTRGKLKNNGKLKSSTIHTSSQVEYCRTLYINITINDINNPLEVIDYRGRGMLNVRSEEYKKRLQMANKSLSGLKIIISRNSEKV